MIKKILFGFTLALSIFAFGFVEKSEATANISPSTQTIYGSQAYASWNFSWTGTGPCVVYFKPDSNSSYSMINASSYSNSMSHSYRYSSSSAAISFTPGVLIEDSNGFLHIASATVYKYLTKP